MVRPRMPLCHRRRQGPSKTVPLGGHLGGRRQVVGGTCVHDIERSTQPWLGVTGVGEPSLSGVSQESSTQPLAREAGHAYRRMSRRRMGARRLARAKRDRRAWSGSGSRSKAPSWRGLPTEVRSVLKCPSKVHNKWLSARGDALGTMGAAAFHGAVAEESGAILVPTQLGFQLG